MSRLPFVNRRKYFAKGSKYLAKKVTTADGEEFDSKGEYRRWVELCRMQERGYISDLKRQVPFVVVPKLLREDGKVEEREVKYIADFVYAEHGRMICEDYKSAMTRKLPEYVIKRKLFKRGFPDYEFREYEIGKRKQDKTSAK